jgi:hypothetical protein
VLTSWFSVSPRTVEPGDSITVRGRFCRPGSYVTVKLDGVIIATGSVNARGNFTATATIPATATPGPHTLWAGCDAGSAGSTTLHVPEAR